MTITDIKIRKIIPDGRLRAVISITIDDQIAIHDIKVVQGDARQSIESQILDAYTRHIEMMQAEAEAEEAGLL